MTSCGIACDIGGTNARFRIFGIENDPMFAPIVELKVRPNDFDSISALVTHFLHEVSSMKLQDIMTIESCCIAICGPVINGVCEEIYAISKWPAVTETAILKALVDFSSTPTCSNSSIRVSADRISCRGMVSLANDFAAMAMGVSHLYRSSSEGVIVTVGGKSSVGSDNDASVSVGDNAGDKVGGHDIASEREEGGKDDSVVAVVGPGTGWGAAIVKMGENIVLPSEAGTRAFAARTEEQWRLRDFIAKNIGEGVCIVENVASGQGIANAYRFLYDDMVNTGDDEKEKEIYKAVVARGAAEVVTHLEDSNLCQRALDLFLEVLAQEVQDTAMMFCPFGGIILAGGVTSRLWEAGLHADIEKVAYKFRQHPILSGMLAKVPFALCLEENAGLLGASLIARVNHSKVF